MCDRYIDKSGNYLVFISVSKEYNIKYIKVYKYLLNILLNLSFKINSF